MVRKHRLVTAAAMAAAMATGAAVLSVWLLSGHGQAPPPKVIGETGIKVLVTDPGATPGAQVTPNPVTVQAVPDLPMSTSRPRTATGLGAPDRLAGDRSSTMVSLRWHPVAGAKAYVIYRDRQQVGETNGLSFDDTGLQPGVAHVWTVAALDARMAPGDLSAPLTLTPGG